jgi:hypothetical protein
MRGWWFLWFVLSVAQRSEVETPLPLIGGVRQLKKETGQTAFRANSIQDQKH